jgi:hypothetical protein
MHETAISEYYNAACGKCAYFGGMPSCPADDDDNGEILKCVKSKKPGEITC